MSDVPASPRAESPEASPSALSNASEALAEKSGRELPRWARVLTRLLDDLIRIPGTEQGIGLDALLGLLPGVGDSATGLGSMALLVLALRQGVPTVILIKMLANIGVDVLTGTVPVLGDLFDVVWRSNKRNLALIEKHARGKEQPSAGDYVLVGVGFVLAATAIAMPFVVSAMLGFSLAKWISGG